MKRYNMLFDLPISDLSLEQTCLLAQNRPKNDLWVWVMADAALALRCHKKQALLDACLAGQRVFAEGQSIRVVAARLGRSFTEKAFSTPELMPALMATGAGRYFFIGGKSGVARRAAVAAAGRLPCPVVGGVRGDFCRKGRENAAVLMRLWEAQADFVLVSMEDAAIWIAENRSNLPPALYILAPGDVMERLAGCGERDERMQRWREFGYQAQLCRRAKRTMERTV